MLITHRNIMLINYVNEKIQLKLPIQEKTAWDNNSEHTLFCLVLKRPLRQMSSAKQNNRDFSGNDVMGKNHSYLLGRYIRKITPSLSLSLSLSLMRIQMFTTLQSSPEQYKYVHVHEWEVFIIT